MRRSPATTEEGRDRPADLRPSSINCVLRRATARDRDLVAALGDEAFSRFGDYGPTLAGWLDRGAAVAWIAAAGARAIGMAIVVRRRRAGFVAATWAELVAIAVAAPWRRAGVGRALLVAAEETARSWGADEMRLHTDDSDPQLRAFFAAAGYAALGPSAVYPTGVIALEMRAVLGPRSQRLPSSSSR